MNPLSGARHLVLWVNGSGVRGWFDFSTLGQWSLHKRLTLLLIFALPNLLLLMALWYWLTVRIEAFRYADFLDLRMQLTTLQSQNQGLMAKTLALAPSTIFVDVIAGNTHNRPELGYLLDFMRDIASKTHVNLLRIRPDGMDQTGNLLISVHAEVSRAALANFWTELILNIPDVELQHLVMQRVGNTQHYDLTMNLYVGIGTYIDERRQWQVISSVADDKNSISNTDKHRHNKGFIVERDSERLVYLLGDNHGRLHRVVSK